MASPQGSNWAVIPAYNAGRLASYAILGVLVAAAGKQVVGLVPALGGPVRFAAGIIMILIGLQIALNWRALKFIERMGAALWQRISPLARGLIPVTNLPRALGLGLLWGLLPCGLVYSVLLIAATASQPTDGALIMLAFGIGTTPAMVATGLGAARLRQWSQNRRARAGLGAIVVVLGLLTLAMPVQKWLVGPDGGGHSHHGHMQGR